MEEQIIYSSPNVQITPTVAYFNSTSYQIANIGSVSVSFKKRFRSAAIGLIILGVIFFLAKDNIGSDAQYIGAAFIAAALVWQVFWPTMEYTLVLKTSSDDIQAITSSNHDFILDLKHAIEQSFKFRHNIPG